MNTIYMNDYFLDFSGSTIHVAEKLLGKALILDTEHGPLGGIINEVEVWPNESLEWWFVPVKTGVFLDLACTLER